MPGDVLGLGAVLAATPYEVTAEIILPTRIKNIRRQDFLNFLERHGQGSLHAAKSLANEYNSAFIDVRRLALSASVAGRLAGVLLEWGKSANSCGQHEVMKFTMALRHEELANVVGRSREAITRMLGRFRREGLIEIRGTSLRILDSQKLERLGV